jgi:hypothetical protein
VARGERPPPTRAQLGFGPEDVILCSFNQVCERTSQRGSLLAGTVLRLVERGLAGRGRLCFASCCPSGSCSGPRRTRRLGHASLRSASYSVAKPIYLSCSRKRNTRGQVRRLPRVLPQHRVLHLQYLSTPPSAPMTPLFCPNDGPHRLSACQKHHSLFLFVQLYKVEPEVFGAWMRILHRVPAARLWLLRFSAQGAENLRKQARHPPCLFPWPRPSHHPTHPPAHANSSPAAQGAHLVPRSHGAAAALALTKTHRPVLIWSLFDKKS